MREGTAAAPAAKCACAPAPLHCQVVAALRACGECLMSGVLCWPILCVYLYVRIYLLLLSRVGVLCVRWAGELAHVDVGPDGIFRR
jgi:hypothetical protein